MRALVLALGLALAAACAGPQRAEHKNLCPGSQTRCMADEECTYDSTRACFACVCRDPEASPQKPGWVPEVPGPPPPRP